MKKGVHILRHTFCSHLSMRGAPAKAIQELAGHADLTMTQRYMHLSPAALDAAIRLLDEPRRETWFGLNRAVDLTLSDAPSCRSLETWGRRAARIKNDQ